MKYFGIPLIGCMIMISCAGQRPVNLGVINGRLTDCPSKPNCVGSQAADEDHTVAPFPYEGSKQSAFHRLKNVLKSFERTTIMEENENYIRMECKSAIMGFVDDVEFYFPDENVIHVRSASRIGYSDLGVNRKRVEQLRKLFAAESIDGGK
ncbi:MAG: DUF1499 domain-containing protein [Pseudomonadota bacterium]